MNPIDHYLTAHQLARLLLQQDDIPVVLTDASIKGVGLPVALRNVSIEGNPAIIIIPDLDRMLRVVAENEEKDKKSPTDQPATTAENDDTADDDSDDECLPHIPDKMLSFQVTKSRETVGKEVAFIHSGQALRVLTVEQDTPYEVVAGGMTFTKPDLHMRLGTGECSSSVKLSFNPADIESARKSAG